MTYTAFSYMVGENIDTFGLFPNSKDCSISFGFWNPEEKTLTLKSKDVVQELKSFQKMNELGEGLFDNKDKTKVLVERRMIENSLSFTLTHENEIKDWIQKYVQNKDVVNKYFN